MSERVWREKERERGCAKIEANEVGIKVKVSKKKMRELEGYMKEC